MIDIGAATDFEKFPAEVTVAGRPFFLIQQGEGYQLLSRICPHAGGYVIDAGSIFLCPIHYWRFEKETGQCVYPPGAKMYPVEVAVEDGRLIADIAPPVPRPVPVPEIEPVPEPVPIAD